MSTEVLLSANGISKRFGAVEALRGVSISIAGGEVVGLVGDNGAGKSTLVKCLAGVYTPDEGHVEVEGTRVLLRSPMHARSLGVETVFQDLALAPDLDVTANVFLGREIRRRGLLGRLGFVNRPKMREMARTFINQVGITTLDSVNALAEQLSGGQQQALAVARARAWASKVLLLDEPTAALGVRQRGIVLDLIRASRDRGEGVMIVAHDLPSLISVADRVVVLRHGVVVSTMTASEVTAERVVAAMLGAPQ